MPSDHNKYKRRLFAITVLKSAPPALNGNADNCPTGCEKKSCKTRRISETNSYQATEARIKPGQKTSLPLVIGTLPVLEAPP